MKMWKSIPKKINRPKESLFLSGFRAQTSCYNLGSCRIVVLLYCSNNSLCSDLGLIASCLNNTWASSLQR